MIKDSSRISCFLIAAIVLLCLSCIGQDIQEEFYKVRGDKIKRDDAKQLLIGDIAALQQRCPQFGSSGYNWTSSYSLMFASTPCGGPSSSSGSSSGSSKPTSAQQRQADSLTGCANYDYLDRSSVNTCRLLIQNDPCGTPSCNSCNEPSFTSNYRFSTFALCSGALRADFSFPFFL
ncbi:hypothetical protein [Leptospira inadai]|uniref:Lipoprotein n=1 Tax=Leptospira inadai serovar Lyme TaxID=293084 RepID=A0ABX4YEZ9_9LEPT|nr:hypothetical protein [Leptospira inadai]PNV73609.1 hypothetical protein BES34_017025 [Leptospira inadai serovar Lyme]